MPPETQQLVSQTFQPTATEAPTLNNLYARAIASSSLPTAPEGREAYAYKRTASGFDLCANFAFPSSPNDYNYLVAPFDERAIKNPDDWTYDAGGVCFERILKPTGEVVVPLQPGAFPVKQ